jgi:tRNA-uridine 2-sulfurtransferase
MNSLGLDKSPQETRIVVAMSGGVDSSVVAALLKEEGYDVVGVTLQLYDHGMAIARKGACCAGQDIYDAKEVADKIGIPHYVLDYQNVFKEDVIDDFAESYLRGETPLPCVRCNQSVKFRDLFKVAKDLGAEALATGHYVKRVAGELGAELHRGKDLTKDQSYFLFATSQEQLDFLRFPLGAKDKAETRALAEKMGLPVSDKPDSQDICFVPNGSYAQLVEKLRPGAIEPGYIIDQRGEILGRHEGIIRYTVGQRKGLDLGGLKTPLYVIRLNPEDHTVVVGPQEALAKNDISLKETTWVNAAPVDGQDVTVKFRSTQSPQAAKIKIVDAKIVVQFAEPQYGVSPGQACVVYDNDRVIGGGWIARDDD